MATESLVFAQQWKDKIKFKGKCLPSALLSKTSAPELPPPLPLPWILVLCLCKTSTEEMTSLRKLNVSFAHKQENCQRYSQADNTFFSQLALQLSVNLRKVTKEEIGLAVVLVTPRTPCTFVSISCLWPTFLISAGIHVKNYRLRGETWGFVRGLWMYEAIFMCKINRLRGSVWHLILGLRKIKFHSFKIIHVSFLLFYLLWHAFM